MRDLSRAPSGTTPLYWAVEFVINELNRLMGSEQSVERFAHLLRKLPKYFEGAHSVTCVEAISSEMAYAFIDSRKQGGQNPADRTRRLRRSTLRLLFRTLRAHGLFDGDPTLDIELNTESTTTMRPLTPEEAMLCRIWAPKTLIATRQPAAVALALAGASSAEIAGLRFYAVDVTNKTVAIPDSTRLNGRTLELDDWGVAQLTDRRLALAALPETFIAYEGNGSPQSKQASVCKALADVLTRAGLNDDPTIGVKSFRAYAANTVFEATGQIEDAARLLGVRSLDQAARLIGYDWSKS